MSKANSSVKVLRTALKRVDEGWTQHEWHRYEHGTKKHYVCLEGAIVGFCKPGEHEITRAQQEAMNVCRQIIWEKTGQTEIPTYNDEPGRTKEEIKELIKLGIIRLETDDETDYTLEDFIPRQVNGS